MRQERLRVLDVHSDEVKVLHSKAPYLALSYVCGQNLVRKLTYRPGKLYRAFPYFYGRGLTGESVARPRKSGNEQVAWYVNLEDLPATIKDAVILARKLEQRFLWVDALCIDQADENDRAAVISKMEAIYSEAYLTIVAAGGVDSIAGLRRMRSNGSESEQPFCFISRGNNFTLLPAKPGYEKAIERTMWNTRAWTFQEHVLSSLSVIFTDEEVFFAGDGVHEREAFTLKRMRKPRHRKLRRRTTGRRLSLKDVFARSKHLPHLLLHQYFEAARDYSRRDLSHPGDRLDAFSGILQFFTSPDRSSLCVQSFGGLLKVTGVSTFLACLHWQPALRSGNIMTRIPQNTARSDALPSWSWIGWLGAIEFDYGYALPEFVLSSDLSDALPIDDYNIVSKIGLLGRTKMWRPPVHDLTPRDGLVLHLWSPILLCLLVPRDPGDESNLQLSRPYRLYDMVDPSTKSRILRPFDADYQKGWSEGFVADENHVSTATTSEGLHEVVCISSSHTRMEGEWLGSFMLVKRMHEAPYYGHFFERVAITAWMGRYCFVNKKTELKHEHVMLI